MYRVHLTEEQREELKRRSHYPQVKPRTRDRLEMVRLSDVGWSIPQIAAPLRMSEKRVRHWIKRYLTGGFDGLPRPAACRPAVAAHPGSGRGPRAQPADLVE